MANTAGSKNDVGVRRESALALLFCGESPHVVSCTLWKNCGERARVPLGPYSLARGRALSPPCLPPLTPASLLRTPAHRLCALSLASTLPLARRRCGSLLTTPMLATHPLLAPAGEENFLPELHP